MYLKKLELHGFKSFPNSTKIEFNDGITSIVGPNGSGKSNISDAIRWVLGEKSAKNLRGGKMEDVIFAGTDLKKPLSFAKVSLVINNEDSKLNIDTEEISITRKMYRQGDNEYFINNKLCRLKDIYELFMDTGIGKEGYSIIGQGRIDEILSGKPEERRLLIEEAVGIVKYKNRKKEAENKLEKERSNLELIENTLNELEKQVMPLKEDSKKAKIFLNFKEQLKKVDINIYIRDIDEFNVQINKVKKDLNLIENDLYDTNQHRILEKQKMQLNKIKFDQTKKKVDNNKKSIVENRLQTEQKYNDIKLFEEQIKNILENINRIEKEVKELRQKNNLITTENNRLLLVKKRMDIEIEEKTESLNKNEQTVNKFKDKLNIYEEELKDFTNKINEKNELLSKFKYNIEINKNKITDKKTSKTQIDEEVINLKKSLEEKSNKLIDVEKEIHKTNNSILNFKNELEKTLEQVEKNNNELNCELAKKNNLTTELQTMMTKIKLLNDYKEQYEGYYYSVKSILKQSKKGELQGVYGTVGELLFVEKKYELAIETALSSRMQNIIVENSNNAKNCIDYLKNNKSGRATLLPLDVIKQSKPYNKINLILKEDGVLGIAKNLISYEKQFESVYSNILERVLIVDNLNNAIKINKKYNSEIKIVTLDGDVLSVGGSMTGGSTNKKSSNLLGREREITELKTKSYAVKQQLDDINKIVSKKQNEVKLENEKIENINNNIQQKIILLNNKEQQKNISMKIIQDIKNDITKKENLCNNQEEEIKGFDEYIVENEKSYSITLSEIENIQKQFDKYKIEIEEKNKDNENLLNVVYDEKLQLSELQLKHSSILDKLKASNELEKEQSNKIKMINDKIVEYNDLINSKKIDIKNSEGDIVNLKEEKNNLENSAEENLKLSKTIQEEISLLDKNIDVLAEDIQSLEKNKIKTQFTIDSLDEKNRKSYDELWTNYNLTYNKSKLFYDENLKYNNLQKDKIKLKTKIKNLGNININAIDKYKEVSERYEFLLAQRNDIILAEEKLGLIINDLSEMIENQFKEKFEIICENFNEVFKEIFGGGFAKLILTDEENILTSGIDIEAKPTGKSLKNINLLSGGEKALTAIALLFAILKMKPSPFCVLDEIDAALDENNVTILAKFLKSFAINTQFIMISHKKGIMEISDIIYGVTMKEQGISSLLSIDFDKI